MHDLETSAPDAFKIITGDFSHCPLKTATTSYFQHAKCPTREDRTLDQCYTNVQDAYTCLSLHSDDLAIIRVTSDGLKTDHEKGEAVLKMLKPEKLSKS